jgi:hypothetical protein
VDAARPEVQRQVAVGAARLAADETGITTDPAVRGGFAAAGAGLWGDTPARVAVQALTDDHDGQYFDLFDSDTGEQLPPFRRARAAAALWFALDADPAHAAAEALYEATFALDADDDARLIELFPPGD